MYKIPIIIPRKLYNKLVPIGDSVPIYNKFLKAIFELNEQEHKNSSHWEYSVKIIDEDTNPALRTELLNLETTLDKMIELDAVRKEVSKLRTLKESLNTIKKHIGEL